MSGWNAVWFLYQAAMVPLVSVFWQWGSPRVPEWLKQIETILELLEAMEEWSMAARRSREVVWRMYEASRAIQAQNPHTNGQAASLAQQRQSQSASPSGHLHIAVTDGMLMDGGELHMSPIVLGRLAVAGFRESYLACWRDARRGHDAHGLHWSHGRCCHRRHGRVRLRSLSCFCSTVYDFLVSCVMHTHCITLLRIPYLLMQGKMRGIWGSTGMWEGKESDATYDDGLSFIFPRGYETDIPGILRPLLLRVKGKRGGWWYLCSAKGRLKCTCLVYAKNCSDCAKWGVGGKH
jgi:hypothetical protein